MRHGIRLALFAICVWAVRVGALLQLGLTGNILQILILLITFGRTVVDYALNLSFYFP